MAPVKPTVFQNLQQALITGFDKNVQAQVKKVNFYTFNQSNNDVIFKSKNPEEVAAVAKQMKQQQYLANQWVSSNKNLGKQASLVTSNLKLMYRDADLMSGWPEIDAALDLMMEESTCTNSKGQILNISSKSSRVKSVLEDLFVNRLDGHVNIPMWLRAMCKYGNCYAMLNITAENGVIGARMLPVYEIDRVESGMYNPYVITDNSNNTDKDSGTQFAWTGANGVTSFQNWQVAHFRLLNDSIFLPYGCSVLNKARRHWRILSMMEDMMLIYRLERSIERRVYKIFVGNIDDADIPAYINDIVNSFKRTPIVDPLTGQLDLRKNMLDVSNDIFMPYKDDATSSKIETLPAASNMDKIEDLSYIQNKLMVALRVPSAFLNYSANVGDGKNLALMDIRFTRTINRIQQSFIMELTKIAAIHLYTLGLGDELNNFKITMNSPSSQSEILKLEEMSKKIGVITDATRDIGNGMQIMSLTRCQREFLGWSDEEISENMLEIRMERALASELTKTDQIIKRTGFFDKIDKLYGEPDADYISDGTEPGGDMGGSAGGGGGADFGDTFGGVGEPMGETGAPETSPTEGNSTELPPVENQAPEQAAPAMESLKKDIDKLLLEAKSNQVKNIIRRKESYVESYLNHLKNNNKTKIEEEEINATPIVDKAFLINEQTIGLVSDLDKLLSKKEIDLSLDLNETKFESTKKSKLEKLLK